MNRSNETWVKNMCRKLEDICMDIDEFVCKDPALFVGNQMEIVGANVKNFFSGFVDDFGLTQVADHVHVAQSIPSKCINLVETSTNSVVEIKENNVDNPKEDPLVPNELCHKPSSTGLHHSEQITSEISQLLIGERDSLINKTPDNTTQDNLNSSINSQNLDNRLLYDESLHSEAAAFEYSDWGIENIIDLNLDIDNMIKGEPLMSLEEKETPLNRPNDELECDSNTSTTHQSSELGNSITCNENQEENGKHIIAGGLSSEKLYESLNSSFRKPDTINCNPTVSVDYFSVSSDILSSSGSFTTLSCDSNNEAYGSCSGTGSADGSMVDFEDVKKDAIESCAISGKLANFPSTSRSKSYRKMIQDAFMSRKRISKEYKQLAIWYGDIDKELCQPTESSKLPVQDSEWELL